MKKSSKIDKTFLAIIAAALVIGGAIYFGSQQFAVRDSEITELKNQLASLQEQIAPAEEPAATSTPVLESEPEPEPEPEPEEEDINQCDYLDCDSLDGWVNSGSTFACQNEDDETCTCRTQVYHNYSCSTSKQKCVYSITDTKIHKYSCVEPEPEPEPEPEYPDFIVQSPSFSPSVLDEGVEMFFWATLKNQGEIAAAVSKSYLKIDGVKIAEYSTPSLVSNESMVVAWSTSWTAIAGEHELEVCADGALVVDESNELNNCTAIDFTVTEQGVSLQPDLIVQSLSISPASTTADQAVIFSGTVKNQGQASVDYSRTRLNLYLDNGETVYMGAFETRALDINETRTESWSGWTAVAGTHEFEICADSTEEVAESNEANNCTSKVFTVQP